MPASAYGVTRSPVGALEVAAPVAPEHERAPVPGIREGLDCCYLTRQYAGVIWLRTFTGIAPEMLLEISSIGAL